MVWLLLLPALWGLADMYICLRFVKKPEVDYTAGTTWYWATKWAFMSQTKLMAEKLPFLRQDLTEALGIRPDDERTS